MVIPEESSFSDHDLLIIIAERTRTWGERFEKLEHRVTELERIEDKQVGFVSGGRFFWSLVTAIPASLAAYFLGNK